MKPQKGIARIKGAAKGEISLNALKWISIAWLVVMLLPLVAMAFYAHPTHDDFPLTSSVATEWARTGSLASAIAEALNHTLELYHTWQGTFVATLNALLQPMFLSPKLFFITPLIAIAVLCLSSAYFIKEVVGRTLGADSRVTIAVYAAFLTLLIEFMPCISEVVYWLAGTCYSLSISVMLIISGLMLKLRRAQSRATRLWRYAALAICGVALGACPYPQALSGAVIAFLVAALCAFKRSKALTGSLISLISIVLSFVLVLIAPGNGVRQQVVGEPMNAPLAIIMSLEECAEQTGKWFSPQLVAFALLMYLLLSKALRKSGISFKYPLLVTVLSFGALSAAFVPPIYATGIDGYKVGRVVCSLYMLFVPLAFINIVYWLGWACSRCKPACEYGERVPTRLLALCAALVVWGFFSQGIFATPSISAAKSLITGEARVYDEEMTAREAALASSVSDDAAAASVSELSVSVGVLPIDMLPYQTGDTLPGIMRRYYRTAELVERYGAGNIPEEQWKALDN